MTSEPTGTQKIGVLPVWARVDVIGGTVMVLIACLVFYGTIGLKLGTIINFGPGAIPRGLAIILFIAGGAVLFHGLRGRGDSADPVVLAFRPPMIMAFAIFIFALFIRGGEFGFITTPQLGLMVVGPLTVFIAGFATPEAKPKELVVMAFGLTAAVLVVFPDILGVPIPVFPKVIENAIPPSFGVGVAVRVLYGFYAVLTAILYRSFFGRGENQSV